VHKLAQSEHQDDGQCWFELIRGSIPPGQNVLAVNGCLASGSTIDALVRLVRLQDGIVERLVCVMELLVIWEVN
jgi:adenine/guanine phosphoribosyltransferase-like PRPP-binding protein